MAKISTTRFGDIEVAEDRIISFTKPILGFEGSRHFVLLDHAPDSPFKWLQSIDDAELAFVVTHPKLFGMEFEFTLSDDAVVEMEIENGEDVLVLTIVNIPQDDPTKMTANLLGPLVINQHSLIGMQIVLNESSYSTKVRLITETATPETASTGKDA